MAHIENRRNFIYLSKIEDPYTMRNFLIATEKNVETLGQSSIATILSLLIHQQFGSAARLSRGAFLNDLIDSKRFQTGLNFWVQNTLVNINIPKILKPFCAKIL